MIGNIDEKIEDLRKMIITLNLIEYMKLISIFKSRSSIQALVNRVNKAISINSRYYDVETDTSNVIFNKLRPILFLWNLILRTRVILVIFIKSNNICAYRLCIVYTTDS